MKRIYTNPFANVLAKRLEEPEVFKKWTDEVLPYLPQMIRRGWGVKIRIVVIDAFNNETILGDQAKGTANVQEMRLLRDADNYFYVASEQRDGNQKGSRIGSLVNAIARHMRSSGQSGFDESEEELVRCFDYMTKQSKDTGDLADRLKRNVWSRQVNNE